MWHRYWLLWLCAGLVSAGDEVREIDLVEMGTRTIVSVASNKHKTLLACTRNMGVTEHYLFDHRKGQAYELRDGRIPKKILSRIVPITGGFVIVDRIGLFAYHIDDKGHFLAKQDIEDFDGFEPDIRPVEIAPDGAGKVLLTYLPMETDYLALAQIDFEKKTFTIQAAHIANPKFQRSYWCRQEDYLYLIQPESGRIDLLDPENYKTLKIIRSARDTVANPYYKQGMGPTAPMARYMRILANPVYFNDRIKLEVPHFRKRDSRVIGREMAFLKNGRFQVEKTQSYTVAEAGGTRLIFDKESGEFQLAAGK